MGAKKMDAVERSSFAISPTLAAGEQGEWSPDREKERSIISEYDDKKTRVEQHRKQLLERGLLHHTYFDSLHHHQVKVLQSRGNACQLILRFLVSLTS